MSISHNNGVFIPNGKEHNHKANADLAVKKLRKQVRTESERDLYSSGSTIVSRCTVELETMAFSKQRLIQTANDRRRQIRPEEIKTLDFKLSDAHLPPIFYELM